MISWTMATAPDGLVRNGREAVGLAEQAVSIAGDGNPQLLDTLAAAYAEAGRFPEAIATAERAIGRAASASDTALAEAIQERVGLYRAGRAFRDSDFPPSR